MIATYAILRHDSHSISILWLVYKFKRIAWCNNIDENELEFVGNFPEFLTGREISRSFKIWEFPTEAIQLNDLMCLSNENKDKIKVCGIVFRLVVEWNLATFFDGEGSCSRLSSWAWLRGGLLQYLLTFRIKIWKLGRGIRLSVFYRPDGAVSVHYHLSLWGVAPWHVKQQGLHLPPSLERFIFFTQKQIFHFPQTGGFS
jgi:hypothetical protein